MSLRIFIVTCGIVVGLAAVVVTIESRKTNKLRWQYASVVEREDTLESRRQRYENLAREEPRSQDQETLQQDIEHLQDLRSTRDALRTQIEQSVKKTLARNTSSQSESVPWNNLGRATPAATVETVFWAMAQADIDTLAALIAFDDDARDQAESLYQVLPDDLREEYESPERLVAALMAIEKPVTSLKSVNVLGVTSSSPDRDTLQLAASSGQISLNFRRDGGGWKLLVPALIIDGYRHYAIGTISLNETTASLGKTGSR